MNPQDIKKHDVILGEPSTPGGTGAGMLGTQIRYSESMGKFTSIF